MGKGGGSSRSAKEQEELKKKINCFAYGLKCEILEIYTSEETCMKCHFRKPERDVTDGVQYPMTGGNGGGWIYRNGRLLSPAQVRADDEERNAWKRDRDSTAKNNRLAEQDRDNRLRWERSQIDDRKVLKERRSGRPCKECYYGVNPNWEGGNMCAYILRTGKKRPCSAEECIEKGVFRPRNDDVMGWYEERKYTRQKIRARELEPDQDLDTDIGYQERRVDEEVENEMLAGRLKTRYGGEEE